MFNNTQKFNKELEALKNLPQENFLAEDRKQQIKSNILRAILAEESRGSQTVLQKLASLFKYGSVVFAVLCLALVGTVYAASNAKPGNVLFPVKKAQQQVLFMLAPNDEAKANLQTQITQTTIEELDTIQAQQDLNTNDSVQLKTQDQKVKTEVDDAINNLKQIQVKLQQKGDKNAAQAIAQSISNFETRINSGGHGHGADNGKKNTDNGQRSHETKNHGD